MQSRDRLFAADGRSIQRQDITMSAARDDIAMARLAK
jgi:hypothetical protein